MRSSLHGESTIAAPADGMYNALPYEFQCVMHCGVCAGGKLCLALINYYVVGCQWHGTAMFDGLSLGELNPCEHP